MILMFRIKPPGLPHVSILTWREGNSGFNMQQGQTEDLIIGICYFSPMQAAITFKEQRLVCLASE